VKRAVFIVGEGVSDIGGLAHEPPYHSDEPGFLQPVIHKALDGALEFAGRQLRLFGKRKVTGLTDAISRKAYLAAIFALDAEADALVFVTDTDKPEGRNTVAQARKRIRELRAAIELGFERAGYSRDRRVIGTPCRTIEAWALADLGAVKDVARADSMPRLPGNKKPEELWGEPHDPSSGHPKCVLARIFGRDVAVSDLADIAERADLEVLRAECPLSFAPFVTELESLPA
jgi:hypothetical protein